MTLQPNYKKIFAVLSSTTLFVVVVAAAISRARDGSWWTAAEAARYLALLLVSPAFLLAVPRRIDWSDAELSIRPRLGLPRTYSWTELVRYGPGEGKYLLVLRFTNHRSFQIFAWAFDAVPWQLFTSFLSRAHPEKRL